jgi:hypothetical protein
MGWMRFLFLGDIGQQMDLDVQAEELRRLREQGAIRRRAFERTDHQLDELREEHEQLKFAVAGLVRRLVAKDVLSRDEVSHIIGSVEPAGEA